MVDKLITNFSLNSDSKSSKKMCKEFEEKNKSAEKYLEKSQMELEQLEFKRLIVCQDGIPWGVNPADHVKNINKKDRSKKKTVSEVKPSPGWAVSFITLYIEYAETRACMHVCSRVAGFACLAGCVCVYIGNYFSLKKFA